MNDFTKEELEELRYCVTLTHGDANGLADKIQSMIYNYCEHEYNEKSVELHAKQCCKCQEVKVL